MSSENYLIGIIAILLFVIGFMYAHEGNKLKLETVNYESDIEDTRTSKYMRFIYIGSRDCGFCNEETHKKVRYLKKALKKFTKNREYKFISSGIALDTYAFNGVKYINKTSPYDEIISGAGWFNLGINHYIWNSNGGEPAVPQVLITFAEFNVISGNNGGILNITRNEKILKRYIGVLELENLNKIVRNKSDEVINQELGLNQISN